MPYVLWSLIRHLRWPTFLAKHHGLCTLGVWVWYRNSTVFITIKNCSCHICEKPSWWWWCDHKFILPDQTVVYRCAAFSVVLGSLVCPGKLLGLAWRCSCLHSCAFSSGFMAMNKVALVSHTLHICTLHCVTYVLRWYWNLKDWNMMIWK